MQDRLKVFYEGKQKEIFDLSEVITKYQSNVEEVRFELYEKEPEGWREEFIIVKYKGGAFSAIGVNGNNFAANYRVVGEVLTSGIYDHDYYEKVKKDYGRVL